MLKEHIDAYNHPFDAQLTDTGFVVQFHKDDEPMYFEKVCWEPLDYPEEGEWIAERATLDGKEIMRERILHLIGPELLWQFEDSYADRMSFS